MSETRTIWDAIMEYVETNHLDDGRKKFFESWSIIAGPSLSSCTSLQKVDLKEGKAYVKASSISARSLLMMERQRIVNDWNRMFPDSKIKSVVVSKRS